MKLPMVNSETCFASGDCVLWCGANGFDGQCFVVFRDAACPATEEGVRSVLLRQIGRIRGGFKLVYTEE
jgi:hypothetical protein